MENRCFCCIDCSYMSQYRGADFSFRYNAVFSCGLVNFCCSLRVKNGDLKFPELGKTLSFLWQLIFASLFLECSFFYIFTTRWWVMGVGTPIRTMLQLAKRTLALYSYFLEYFGWGFGEDFFLWSYRVSRSLQVPKGYCSCGYECFPYLSILKT